MKKILFTSVLILFTAITAYSYDLKNRTIALFDFNLNISEEAMPPLLAYNEPINDVKKNIKVMLYGHLEGQLRMECGLDFLPIRSFMRSAKYDDAGFPSISIQKAIRRGSSKCYIRVEIDINETLEKGRVEFGKKESVNDSIAKADTLNLNPFMPEVILSVYVYNNRGYIPVDKYIYSSKAENLYNYTEPIFLDGVLNRNEWEERETLFNLFDKAIDKLINKIND